VGRTISEYAGEAKADAVVIGSRGLGAFRRRLLGLVGLGSVSDYVAHHAPCTGGGGAGDRGHRQGNA